MSDIESDYSDYDSAKDDEGGLHCGRSDPSRGLVMTFGDRCGAADSWRNRAGANRRVARIENGPQRSANRPSEAFASWVSAAAGAPEARLPKMATAPLPPIRSSTQIA